MIINDLDTITGTTMATMIETAGMVDNDTENKNENENALKTETTTVALYDHIQMDSQPQPQSRDHRDHSGHCDGPYAQRLKQFELKTLLNQKM